MAASEIVKRALNCQGPNGLSVSVDTRTLQPGDIFFALKGKNADGHLFVGDAFAKGAVLAVVEPSFSASFLGAASSSCIVVDSAHRAICDLARAVRMRTQAKIVAITGSVGKTTLKDMLASVCSRFGPTVCSRLSYNNHIGVPLSLCRLKSNTSYGVFEIGTSSPGEVSPLSVLVSPHVAVITRIGLSHMAHFSSVREVRREKMSIRDGLRPGGVLITSHPDDVSLLRCRYVNPTCTQVEATISGEFFSYTLGASGRHMVDNSLLTLACAKSLGIPLDETVKEALRAFRVPNGRGRLVPMCRDGIGFYLIDGSYNANPTSMASAIELLGLSSRPTGRKVAVLGDMLELGGYAPQAHRRLLKPLQDAGVNTVIGCGSAMRHLFEVLPQSMRGFWVERWKDLQPKIWDYIEDGSYVLLKASFGTGFHQLFKEFEVYRQKAV